jgi:hypothetical protein
MSTLFSKDTIGQIANEPELLGLEAIEKVNTRHLYLKRMSLNFSVACDRNILPPFKPKP